MDLVGATKYSKTDLRDKDFVEMKFSSHSCTKGNHNMEIILSTLSKNNKLCFSIKYMKVIFRTNSIPWAYIIHYIFIFEERCVFFFL